jgi:hypothetical protein
MHKQRLIVVLVVMVCLLAGSSAISSGAAAQPQNSTDEQRVWDLEAAYWVNVQVNNLADYLKLWDKDFLGWPSVSAAPVRKDHITDWITSQTGRGLMFKSAGGFKPAAIQITGNVAVTCYWFTYKWVDKDEKGEAHAIRVTHTWIKDGKDWRIIGGMSMAETASP